MLRLRFGNGCRLILNIQKTEPGRLFPGRKENNMEQKQWITFRIYFPNGNRQNHGQYLSISEIGKWIECYKFTHPDAESITAKVWFNEPEKEI